jgi:hypothetical protein
LNLHFFAIAPKRQAETGAAAELRDNVELILFEIREWVSGPMTGSG